MPKPGERARRVARDLRWSLIKKNRRLVLSILAVALVIAAAVLALVGQTVGETAGAFVAGILLTGIGWFMWELIESQSGARTYASGALGEDLTADVLKKVKGHQLVHGLKFHGFDVDHVMVGPSGVWAVETKWTSRNLDLSMGGKERRVIRDIGNAQRGAGQISRFLRLAHRIDSQVLPLLVVWGSGVRDVEAGGMELNGVIVVVGRQAKKWRANTFSAHRLEKAQQEAAIAALIHQESRQT